MNTLNRFLSVLRAAIGSACSFGRPGAHARLARANARVWHASWRRGLVVAVNDSALFGAVGAVNEAIGANEWVRVAPFGEWPNSVGLQVFDREAADSIVSAFNTASTKAATLWRGLPIYEGHPDEPQWAQANPSYKRVALGRVKALETRTDGLYAKVAFNDQGNALVRGEAPAYEAQSPRWGMAKTTHKGRAAFRPLELYSLGLTNQPNIPGTQLGLNERTEISSVMKQNIIALLAALGRPLANASAVTDEQLAAAVNEAVPVATATITAQTELATVKPKLVTAENEVNVLKAKLQTAEQTLVSVKADAVNERTARIDTILTSAVNTGRVPQAKRDEWKNKLVAATAANDFTAIETEIGKLKPASNTQAKVAGLGARKPEELASINRVAAINEAIETKKKANPNISHTDAYNAVRNEKPDLFVTATA